MPTDAQIKTACEQLKGVKFEYNGHDVEFVDLRNGLENEACQSFVEAEVKLEDEKILMSKIVNEDFIKGFVKGNQLYKVKDNDLFFAFPGVLFIKTDKANVFETRVLLTFNDEHVDEVYAEVEISG